MELLEAIELFLIAKQIEPTSPKTIRWYGSLLGHFADHVGNGEGVRLQDISLDDGREFVAALQARTVRYDNHPYREPQAGGPSPSTVHAYVRTLKAFSTWLHEDGLTRDNMFARLKRPKLPKPVIKILTEQEIHSILDSINPNCFLGARQNLIVLLLLDTGIRASELCSLTLPAIYMDENKILVKGKGRKERIVPFANGTKRALIRYVSTWRPEPLVGGTDTLILSVNGTPLTYNGLSLAIRRLGRRAGVPRLHAHCSPVSCLRNSHST
jgi:site-specific recombinase XerD